MTRQLFTVAPVWLLVLAGAVVVAIVLPPEQYLTWIGVVLAGAVIATFGIQLAFGRVEGFVTRTMASIGVSVVILAIAAGIVALVG